MAQLAFIVLYNSSYMAYRFVLVLSKWSWWSQSFCNNVRKQLTHACCRGHFLDRFIRYKLCANELDYETKLEWYVKVCTRCQKLVERSGTINSVVYTTVKKHLGTFGMYPVLEWVYRRALVLERVVYNIAKQHKWFWNLVIILKHTRSA